MKKNNYFSSLVTLIKAVILTAFIFLTFEKCNAQLSYNAKRVSTDTLRARSPQQYGTTGTMLLPYNYDGLFPTVTVNDTLLHVWIKKNAGGGSTGLSRVLAGDGINILNDSIVNLGGSYASNISLYSPTQNRFALSSGDSSIQVARFVMDNSATQIQNYVNGGGYSFLELSYGGFITQSSDLIKTKTLQFSPSNALFYSSDYSSDYGLRTLPDKQYVDTHLGGNNVSGSISSPGVGNNGQAVTWNNGTNQYELTTIGGGVSAGQGINITGGNTVNLGGSYNSNISLYSPTQNRFALSSGDSSIQVARFVMDNSATEIQNYALGAGTSFSRLSYDGLTAQSNDPGNEQSNLNIKQTFAGITHSVSNVPSELNIRSDTTRLSSHTPSMILKHHPGVGVAGNFYISKESGTGQLGLINNGTGNLAITSVAGALISSSGGNFDISNGGTGRLKIQNNGTSGLQINNQSSQLYLVNSGSSTLIENTNGPLTMTSSANNTTMLISHAPQVGSTSKLQIVKSNGNGEFEITQSGNNDLILNNTTANGLQLINGGSVSANTGITINNSSATGDINIGQLAASKNLTIAGAVTAGPVIISHANSSSGISITSAGTTTLTIESTAPAAGLTIVDNRATKSGALYAADYSANYTNRSLVDKEYADRGHKYATFSNAVPAPSAATITSLFGSNASNAVGVVGVIKNTNGAGSVWLIVNDGTNWYVNQMTAA